MGSGTNGIPGAATVVPFTNRTSAPCGPRRPAFFHWRDFKDWVVSVLGSHTVELSAKADKVSDGTVGNLAGIGAGGNLVDSGLRADGLQPLLVFDTVPTAGSLNPVTSGGIKQAIDAATPGDYDSVKTRLATVEGKIPLQASAQNQLADKAFVNSSIATNTANYIYKTAAGKHVPFDSLAELQGYTGTLTNNDYAFVVGTDATGNTTYTRYKWNGGTEEWAEEYVLNNSSFTAEQWAAISSGITSGLVAKLDALPTAEALAAALAGKASTADATLTPIYSDTPTFSKWVFSDGLSHQLRGPEEGGGGWYYVIDEQYNTDYFETESQALSALTLNFYDTTVTATRTRTDIIGYTLGSQSGKPLQPKGDYAPATGIQKSALAQNVQTSLDKADSALQTTGGRMTGNLHIGPQNDDSKRYRLYIHGMSPNGYWRVVDIESYGFGLTDENDNRYQVYFPSQGGMLALAAPGSTTGNLAALDAGGNPVDSGVAKSDVESLFFAQYYPEGTVKSAAEFTARIKYDAPDTVNRTITVKPFCNTRTSDDNSSLAGRVVIPPFVDASGNGYISDDGTRYKVVGVSDGESLGAASSLTAIVAPSTVTTVGQCAFMDCESLASVSLPAATVIGESAFDGCTLLASVSLPAATTIGSQAFNSCTSLTSVSLPAAMAIGEYAFINCTALTSVSLPAATSIGNGAFMDCSSLDSVDFGDMPRPSVPVLGQYVFSSVPTSCKIIVPDAQYDVWTAASGWNNLVTAGYEFLIHSEWGYARKYEVDKKVDALARYAHVTKTLENNAAVLDDRAINAVGLPSGTASATLTLPAAVPGRVRDFIIRLTLAAAASVSFGSAAGETVTWDSSGNPSGTFQAGTHLLSFTEVAPGVFRWGKPQADLTGQTFDFSTMQGVIDALAAVVTVLGGSVLHKPSAT